MTLDPLISEITVSPHTAYDMQRVADVVQLPLFPFINLSLSIAIDLIDNAVEYQDNQDVQLQFQVTRTGYRAVPMSLEKLLVAQPQESAIAHEETTADMMGPFSGSNFGIPLYASADALSDVIETARALEIENVAGFIGWCMIVGGLYLQAESNGHAVILSDIHGELMEILPPTDRSD